MGGMPRIADPRGPELEHMLAALSPLRELAYRMVLSGLSPHCREDQCWRARIDELRTGLSVDDMAAVLAEAASIARELKGDL
jgi:hypothetical protein